MFHCKTDILRWENHFWVDFGVCLEATFNLPWGGFLSKMCLPKFLIPFTLQGAPGQVGTLWPYLHQSSTTISHSKYVILIAINILLMES